MRRERGRGRLCLCVRELAGGQLVRTARTCSRATRRWRRLSLRYRAATDGSALGLSVVKPRARRGDAFRVDRVALERPGRTVPLRAGLLAGAAFDYADFAGWAASYWRGRVAAWEVWNEPDPWQPF
ncbi:MAG TPA: hypothetical protein VFL61_14615 [Gaiellaceae bacterium]|nr:hypothetical protein [Gaiellaceae bacterium]